MEPDPRRPHPRPQRQLTAAVTASFVSLAALAWLAATAAAARADDRSLLHGSQQNPYVFIILDTSGSMHQSTACSAADIAAHYCTEQCDQGDCLPHLMGDDRNSKIFTAKQAIYNLMLEHPNVNFGFSHFDQGGMHMSWKYWWYAVAATNPSFITLDDGVQYPGPGQLEIFGQPVWACTDARKDNTGPASDPVPLRWVSCPNDHLVAGQPANPVPAHVDDTWEWERARRYPKLGDKNDTTSYYYFTEKSDNSKPTYRITFTPVTSPPQTLGSDPIQVQVTVERCNPSTDPTCQTGRTLRGTKVMTFNKANEMVYWEPGEGVSKAPSDLGNGGGAFFGNTAREISATSNANQLDMNYTGTGTNDTSHDQFCSGSPQFCVDTSAPVITDPRGIVFSSGDFIPLDWKSNQQTTIMQRMAPNLLTPGTTIPDFGISDYFNDHRQPSTTEQALRLKNPAQAPLAPDGGTPTGHVMGSFLNWLQGPTGNSATGFIQAASAPTGDPFFPCKPMYILLVTDGQASGSDGNTDSTTQTQCQNYYNWVKTEGLPTPPGYACCVGDGLRRFVLPSGVPGAGKPYPIRTYVVGLGLTTLQLGGFNNTLQCVADQGGTGNRHFFKGDPNTYSSSNPGYPKSDNPADVATFCSPSNPCDGPGPLLPTSPASVAAALESILSLITSQESAFASAAVPAIQANVQNKELISSFLPINQPIWPGRIDAFSDPVPTHAVPVTLPDGSPATATVPDNRPTAVCTSPGQQGCLLWSAGGGEPSGSPGSGDTILDQLKGTSGGYDTSTTSADPNKRRVYYAPATPIVPGERRLSFQAPAVTDTAHLFDLENALGLCGPGYSYYPPSSAACTENGAPTNGECTKLPAAVALPTGCTPPPPSNPPFLCPSGQSTSCPPYSTAQQAITFTESIKTYLDPVSKQPIDYVLGDIFHSDPQVLGQPNNSTLFNANVDNYQAFANAERFRRKVLYFGSNDGELHALDVGTVQQGTSAGQPAWVFGNGTGKELFAFIPRTVMPTLNQLAIARTLSGGSQTFMVDGPVHLSEGFFDATGGNNPAWHSLIIGGLREGGHGYYALDVTQPDTLQSDHLTPGDSTTPAIQRPDASPPNFLPDCINGGSGCGQLPYATPLWEFTDSCQVVSTGTQLKPCDEDPPTPAGPWIGQPDLGEAWSRANSGRVRVCDAGGCSTFHEQWVVVFGGGMDPAVNNSQGNWLYMLDMATGKVIYKRQLNGSVASEPAAVDTGQDGFIDTIYVGTTAGHLYKIDLTLPAPIDATGRVTSSYWKPFEIFDTQGRAMFYPPAVFFDSDINQFGLAWGTGNRFDLWQNDSTTGRFYVLIDTGFTAANTTPPLNAGSLQQLTPDGALNPSSNFLVNPPTGKVPGYYFELAAGERVVNQAFALAGVLIYGSYVPKPLTSAITGNTVCADSGDTKVFVLNVDNGDPVSKTLASEGTPGAAGNGPGGGPTNRYFVIVDRFGLNINSSESTPIIATKTNPHPPQPPAPSQALKDMIAAISKINPTTCRYSNKLINVTVTDTFNTTYPAAAIPVCIIEKNWKEF
jgi:hypothetical protein